MAVVSGGGHARYKGVDQLGVWQHPVGALVTAMVGRNKCHILPRPGELVVKHFSVHD